MADLTQSPVEPPADPPPPPDRQRDREMANLYRSTLISFIAKLLPPEGNRSTVDRLLEDWLAALSVDLESVITGVCHEDPTKYVGSPMGQYHCPACGCMVVAGMAHPPCGESCRLGLGVPDLDEVVERRVSERPSVAIPLSGSPLAGDGRGNALPPLRFTRPGGDVFEAP